LYRTRSRQERVDLRLGPHHHPTAAETSGVKVALSKPGVFVIAAVGCGAAGGLMVLENLNV
jgi:ABC-type branched-subunit amino acid transport system permease subunit